LVGKATCSSKLKIFHLTKQKIEAQQFYSRFEETSSRLANYLGSMDRQDQQFAKWKIYEFLERTWHNLSDPKSTLIQNQKECVKFIFLVCHGKTSHNKA